jgi:hypothetical protein
MVVSPETGGGTRNSRIIRQTGEHDTAASFQNGGRTICRALWTVWRPAGAGNARFGGNPCLINHQDLSGLSLDDAREALPYGDDTGGQRFLDGG